MNLSVPFKSVEKEHTLNDRIVGDEEKTEGYDLFGSIDIAVNVVTVAAARGIDECEYTRYIRGFQRFHTYDAGVIVTLESLITDKQRPRVKTRARQATW